MPRPIRAEIDLSALRHNLAQARRRAHGRMVWAVIKANAYGHGIERAVHAFAEADGLALLDLAEAERVRAAGWTKPILLLEGFFEPRDLHDVEQLDLTCVVHHQEQVRMLQQHSGKNVIPVYVKLNTGMNRLGLADVEAVQLALQTLSALPKVKIASLMMHFANAERLQRGPADVEQQLACFAQMRAGWTGSVSLCNSGALFLREDVGGDAVRPGIVLYGATPDAARTADSLGLRPAMRLRSRLISTQQLAKGDAVGYGAQFIAPAAMRIGIVACGYADGYPRVVPNGTPVAVDGVRTGLVGRVSMDMLCVDLTSVPQANVGSEVELWGTQIAIDEVGAAAGTVGYELMCALASRVPVQTIDV